MSKKTVFTTITPISPAVSREIILNTLHNHAEMIDLNPLVIARQPCAPPAKLVLPEEQESVWYAITDCITYIPGISAAKSKVTYHGCFHDLSNGLQTHVHAPMGLEIRSKWTVGGNMPGEPKVVRELGHSDLNIPADGLYLREDVEMKCNMLMTSFVKKTLKKSHKGLVDKLVKITELQNSGASQLGITPQIVSKPEDPRPITMTEPSQTSGFNQQNQSLSWDHGHNHAPVTSVPSHQQHAHWNQQQQPPPPPPPSPPQQQQVQQQQQQQQNTASAPIVPQTATTNSDINGNKSQSQSNAVELPGESKVFELVA